ncbi:MAG: hypothetical protein ABR874_21840 [Candidatus Sulfotelmatobacter sp.]
MEVETNVSAKLCHPVFRVVNADKLFLLRRKSSPLVLVAVPEISIDEDGEALSGNHDIGFSRQGCVTGAK